MTVKGVLWHSTGANNKTLKRYVQPSDVKPPEDTYTKEKWLQILGKNAYGNDWNHISRDAGLNFWIGTLADGTVAAVQTMPWDYRPWGCGSGKNGSCNDGWIQFEICEDGLTDKTYFDKVYKEACEMTAYLCDMFGIDPNGTVTHNGVKVPTILCHGDSHKLGVGSNHGDVNHWFPKHGKSMATARADVAAILKAAKPVKTYKVVTSINKYSTASDAKAKKNSVGKYAAGTYYIYSKYPNGSNGMYNITTDSTATSAGAWINPAENVIQETVKKLYRVRKSKDDAASQKGAFSDLANAKTCCQTAGEGYHVFDWDWKVVYSYVAPVTLSTIAVTTKPAKVEYFVGDKFDATGMVVTATYSDKSTKKVTGYTTTGFSSTKAGTVTLTVTFEKKTATFTVAVKEKPVVAPTLTSIAVTTAPAKTVYTVGDTYSGEGLVVTATYSDNSKKVVTNYSVSGFSSAKAGTCSVTVTYEGKVATFQIVVKEKEIVVTPTAVYDLDYPVKTKIVDRAVVRNNSDCTKAIKAILKNNSAFDVEIAKSFFKLAPLYGIDPMMAIAQSILETGWFKYNGSAVTADQHNYCGLGVTSTGIKGNSFATIDEGVTAQLQHLYAYGTKEALPANDVIVDPRFKLVTRGIAVYWQQLAGRWACPGYDTKTYATPEAAMKAENTYGQKIEKLFDQLVATAISQSDIDKYFEIDVPEVDPIEPKPVDPVEPNPVQPDVEDDNLKEDAAFVIKWLKKIIEALIRLFSKGE